ncbi:hypothetical protein ACLB2K_045277 [Fragaria x ananassa]
MKRKHMMLSLLISGPKQPENDIDVYLELLIDDLKLLWAGVSGVYDAVKNEIFTLRAVLFWTINDFLVYGNLSGSIVKGYNGCPICLDQTEPTRLKNGRKMSHNNNRRFLEKYRPYRKLKAAFNNRTEDRTAPVPLTGEELLRRLEEEVPKLPLGKKDKTPIYKGVCKGYVKNRTYPEGCIAERCIAKEAIELIEENYFDDITVGIPPDPNTDDRPTSGATVESHFGKDLDEAHLCVLQNTDEFKSYFMEHMEYLKREFPQYKKKSAKWLVDKQNLTFADWVKERVAIQLSEPDCDALRLFPLCKCDWVESHKGVKVDDLGFTLVNLNRKGHVQDTFVLGRCVEQIFYVEDLVDCMWSVVLRLSKNDYNDRESFDKVGDTTIQHPPSSTTMPTIQLVENLADEDVLCYMRAREEIAQSRKKKKLESVDALEEKKDFESVEYPEKNKASKSINVPEKKKWTYRVGDPEIDCKLVVGSMDNIVAHATIMESGDDPKAVIHGRPLGDDNRCVSVYYAIDEKAKVPFPVEDEIVTVKHAMGSWVAWPKDLIILPNEKPGMDKVSKKKRKRPKLAVQMEEADVTLAELTPILSRSYETLCTTFKDGRELNSNIEPEIIGYICSNYITEKDVVVIATMKKVTGNLITSYQRYLYSKLEAYRMMHIVAFVHPSQIGAIGCGTGTQRTENIAQRLATAKPGQVFMLPYNSGDHWTLTIVDPNNDIVYFMDPVRRHISCGDWVKIVKHAMGMANTTRKMNG